jgi:hypothetical protein
VLLAIATAGLAAQESARTSRPGEVPALIQQLDSDDFSVREEATKRLGELGEAARAALLAAREAGSLERRMRIGQILEGFGARAASRPARREPTLVSLNATNRPLSEVCADLSLQSGHLVRMRGGENSLVTLALKDAPFFQAVDLACAQTGRRIGWDQRERGLVIEPTAERAEPVAYAGPLRVALVMLVLNRQIRFAGGTASGSASVQIRLDAENRSQALGVMMPIAVTEALDDRNRSLRFGDGGAVQPSSRYVQRCDQNRRLQTFVPMAIPETDAKAISRLAFTLSTILPTELYEADIANPEEGSEAGQGAFRVSIEEWKDGPAQRDVRLAISRPAIASGPAPMGSVQEDLVTFFAADGQPIMPTTTASGGGTSFTYTATMPLTPKVARVRVSSLKQFEIAELPVVFTDVPLP